MTFDAAAFLDSIEFIDKKIPLPLFHNKLRELGLPLTSSWGRTLGGLQDIANSGSAPKSALDSLMALQVWIGEYLSHYSKAILVCRIPLAIPGATLALADSFEKGLLAIHLLSNHPRAFPGLLGKNEVGLYNGRIVLRDVEKDKDFTSFIFSAVKEYQVRDVIQITQSDGKALAKLDGYTKVIAIKIAAHEHIDVVRFRTAGGPSGFSEDGIDLILDVTKPGSTPLNSDEISSRAKQYTDALNGAISASGGAFKFSTSCNFFGAMDNIYRSTSGNICELYFTTTLGGSVKREKMKKNTTDLRTETWHAGGQSAINSAPVPDSIDIYRLGVSWKIAGDADEPILIIPGSYRSLTSRVVDHAIVLGCTGPKSFQFAFSQLMKYC
ncbi:hypothetical protein [Pseudomonas viridiflava]|uniref:hypothetical protein n=1 Tax=Pseudomonas viridiflava TaxID=33069 RepID=UPI000F04B8DF|nr:hypothetical protein [Pseudomonas viridiflava]